MVTGITNDNVLIGLACNDTLDDDSGAKDQHGGSRTDTPYGDTGDDLLYDGTGYDLHTDDITDFVQIADIVLESTLAMDATGGAITSSP